MTLHRLPPIFPTSAAKNSGPYLISTCIVLLVLLCSNVAIAQIFSCAGDDVSRRRSSKNLHMHMQPPAATYALLIRASPFMVSMPAKQRTISYKLPRRLTRPSLDDLCAMPFSYPGRILSVVCGLVPRILIFSLRIGLRFDSIACVSLKRSELIASSAFFGISPISLVFVSGNGPSIFAFHGG